MILLLRCFQVHREVLLRFWCTYVCMCAVAVGQPQVATTQHVLMAA
jgi:hypothetical protein